MNLNGKNVVYIGGFGGIGLATCKDLLKKEIAHLVILDKVNNPTAFNELKLINPKTTTLHFFEYDVTMSKENMKLKFLEILRKIKTLDLLIYGAGVCNERNAELTMQINLTGLIKTADVAIEFMDKRREGGNGGAIVNIASVAGLASLCSIAAYCASKAGSVSFTRSLAQMEPLTGIKSYAICSGLTRTPLLDCFAHTFHNVDPNLMSKLEHARLQTVEDCSKNTLKAIEQNINDAIWLLNLGKMEKVEMKQYWKIPEEIQ